MKELTVKYYHLLMLITYIGVINFKSETSYVDAVTIVFLFGHTGYQMYLQSKGKILDKDELLKELKSFSGHLKTIESDMESLKKENRELSNRISTMQPKNILSNSQFKY